MTEDAVKTFTDMLLQDVDVNQKPANCQASVLITYSCVRPNKKTAASSEHEALSNNRIAQE